jgi:hypothetical protein
MVAPPSAVHETTSQKPEHRVPLESIGIPFAVDTVRLTTLRGNGEIIRTTGLRVPLPAHVGPTLRVVIRREASQLAGRNHRPERPARWCSAARRPTGLLS